MKKSVFFIGIGIATVLLVFVSAYSQEDMVVVNSDAFDNPQRPPSVFRHEEHNERAEIEACNECHHVYDDAGNRLEDESSEDQRCSECHEQQPDGRKPALMKAFHNNCKGCHKQRRQGPVMCGQCHVRGRVSDE